MPKAYSAAIPIYRELAAPNPRPPLSGESVGKRTPWGWLDQTQVGQDFLRWFQGEDRRPLDLALTPWDAVWKDSVATAILVNPNWWDRHWEWFGLAVQARYVLEPMVNIRNLALWATDHYKDDVLAIDDFFLTFCNPRINDHIEIMEDAADRESRSDYQAEIMALLRSWPLDEERLQEIAFDGEEEYACWHPGRAHSDFRHRGRQWTSARRAATWATYCFAWLTGSESAAVRLWNAWGDDARWGTDDPSGIKKYGVAKRRLVDSLRWAMGPAVAPPNSWARPYDPLPGVVFDTILAAVQRLRTSEEIVETE